MIKKGERRNNMRLWHKDLISVLPREQLTGAWRECSAIAGAILKNGTPNHVLVNKVLDYPISHFISYSKLIRAEMTRRGYRTMQSVEDKIVSLYPNYLLVDKDKLYSPWHNDRYLMQCYYNLQEKYDCGGIPQEDWDKIEKKMHQLEEVRYNKMQLKENK